MILENHLSALVTMMDDFLEEASGDLSPRAASILITLLNRGSLGVSEIAEICGTSQPTATRLVDGLVKQDLAERGARSGRSVIVGLTKLGADCARHLQAVRRDCMALALADFDNGEREVLATLVDKLLFTGTRSRAHARTTCRYCNHGVCSGPACPVNRKASQIEEQEAEEKTADAHRS